jgi:lysyl-tRNA synthetase class 2
MESIIGRIIENNDQTRTRLEHLERIREIVGNAYPNKFERSRITGDEDTITAIVNYEPVKNLIPRVAEGEKPAPEQLEAANRELNQFKVRVAGRIATPPRVMGKAAFVHLSDGVSRLQIYIRKSDVRAIDNNTGASVEDAEAGWKLFNLLDHGDFVGIGGYLFVTKTGELSVHVETLQFLTKALEPMPDKMHGISDPEIRRRRRYVDLIADSLKIEREPGELSTRETFERRYRIIREMRRYLDEHGYIEVETPMLSPLATGAAARPFVTHHNALDIDLYARIAPELYLKRLLVGGFERVYELNRNFRNEGIDSTHNPEFTMLEFYCAYMDVTGMMDFCEALIRDAVIKATGGTKVKFGDKEIDFAPNFERLTMRGAVKHFSDDENVKAEADRVDNKMLVELFEQHAEPKLIQPTFIFDFPKIVSPLSKASPQNPQIAERFELFIAGMECANGFSELNDPQEQYERFKDQMQARERGDEEAMVLDEDYIRALSYGMPPAAGIGIGIDRLVMILTNRHSIRDVILFPHMKSKEKHANDE